ncbi:hypothetical protein BGX27_007243 [Mortierella sp. AM989]|nr:hypothetical protein BGX27_007243 [Mortierella sp. AM989]
MPKDATSSHSHEQPTITSTPLNEDNLIKHTEHYQKLVEKRDFVREYLDSLHRTAGSDYEPEPAVTVPNLEIQGHNPNNKEKISQPRHHRQQSQTQKRKQLRNAQVNDHIQFTNEVAGTQSSSKKRKESSSTLIKESDLKGDSGASIVQDKSKSNKKRRNQPSAIELEVKNLVINESISEPRRSEDRYGCRSTKVRKVNRSQIVAKSTQEKSTTLIAKNHLNKGDRHVSIQPEVSRKSRCLKIKPRYEQKDGKGDTRNDKKFMATHHHDHRDQNILTTPKRKTTKSDSNKPRKILTQGSLIMNQFVSPNITKERITMPGKLTRLGIFKKGRASQKTSVQKAQRIGNEFLEDAFLNKRATSGQSGASSVQGDVVTSVYFTPSNRAQHTRHPAPSNHSTGENEDDTSTSYESKKSNIYQQRQERKEVRESSSQHEEGAPLDPGCGLKRGSSTYSSRSRAYWKEDTCISSSTVACVQPSKLKSHFKKNSIVDEVDSLLQSDQFPSQHQAIAALEAPSHQAFYYPSIDSGWERDQIPAAYQQHVMHPAMQNPLHLNQDTSKTNSPPPSIQEYRQYLIPDYTPEEYSTKFDINAGCYGSENQYGQDSRYFEGFESVGDITLGLTCPLPRMKEQVLEQAPKKIKQIQFGVLSPQEIVNVSEFEVTQRDLYTVQDRQPVKYGMLDLRLGTSDKVSSCETCGLKQQDCIGHFAHIRLCLPVFHIGYFRAAIVILQNICKTCSKVLLSEKDRRTYLKKLRAPNLENLTRKNVVKAINDKCKKVVHCPYCEATNGTVKKVGALRIVHEKYRAKKVAEEYEQFKSTFNTAIEAAPEMKAHISKAQEDMNPLRVLNLFKAITDEDCELLGMSPDNGRPEMYLWQNIAVPPVCIRPSVQQDGASNEDDITVKLTEVIFTNAHMQAGLNQGIAIHNLMEQWDFLQLSVAMYINSELPGISNLQPGKPVRGFCQRLKGKQGRFRGNLSGKRVDFSGRTVISPDPNLRIDQVAVPELVAKNLTYPERVTTHNIERLRKAISNGTEVHPGANYVTLGSSNMKKSLKFGNRAQIASEIQVGDLVERHLNDGDVVLFNRQPSLHKLSIMAHYAKIRPWRTFRFNECVCNPYNADFDGDEMNLHVPQTEEARTEAIELMGVKNNLVTPRNGTPLIAAIQDFITASYLITQKDLFYDRAQFVQICSYLGDAELMIDIPPPAILKPAQRWTGKQIISVLLKPNKQSKVLVNLEAKTRSYDRVRRPIMDMCNNDGYLVIYNSEIMCGALDKSIVGDGNKSSLFYIVMRDYGSVEAAKCMNRLAKLCARWLGTVGFSIGINDVQPGEILASKKNELVQNAYSHCDDLIYRSLNGQLENQPGCDIEQTLEALISGELSQVRDKVGDICLTELNKYNSPLIMATCGSKGSKINVSQMVACVGQQIISGKRIPNGFQDRSLPHFLKNSKVPPAKGFVRNSFYSGLTPTEFFFHAVSGREGLVDTAVKTAETGYMQRRLMKALEDLTTHYDLSVRNSVGAIIQFTYGSDGLDPAVLEGNGTPVLFDRNFASALHILPITRGDRRLLPYQIMAFAETTVGTPRWARNCSREFIDSLMLYIRDHIAGKLQSIRESYGMMSGQHDPGEEYEGMDIDEFVSVSTKMVVNNKLSVTERQMERFMYVCWDKFMKAKIEPASAVGAVGAQSIGEPGTQMTLKTFHFAGVASMNITLGVPRIKEIINAAKVIATPIITTKLVNNMDVKAARIVKGRIEKTMLGDIAEFIEEVYKPDECYIGVRLDMEAIRRLQLETDLDEVAKAIGLAPKLKIGTSNVQSHKPDRLRIYVQSKDPAGLYYSIKQLKRALPEIIIKGLPQVNRAVINEIQGSGGCKELLVEGYGLRELMNTEGVVGTQTRSNHVMEVWKVLGIEAARRTILDEIKSVMDSHGLTIDPRHVMLLGDIMTSKGEVLGITRFGIAKMKDSVMMLASFEKTTDHLFEASLYSKKDAIEGVSECIIMGIPMSIGTGLFKLIKKDSAQDRIPLRRRLLFDP